MMTQKSALFVPHGSPMFALYPGAVGPALAAAIQGLATPRAIVVISPHWETDIPTVGFASQLETIHDFGGFDPRLFEIQYPATGCPEAAHQVVEVLEDAGFPVSVDQERGLDHGAWVPLRQMYPDADVPVVPVSLQSHLGVGGAYQLGQALAPLRAQGFLIIGSGNITHNLGDYRLASSQQGASFDYLRAFPDWMKQQLQNHDLNALLDYRRRAPDAARAHPSDEHLQPLYVALGAAGPEAEVEQLHNGISDYVLAMDAYAFNASH